MRTSCKSAGIAKPFSYTHAESSLTEISNMKVNLVWLVAVMRHNPQRKYDENFVKTFYIYSIMAIEKYLGHT